MSGSLRILALDGGGTRTLSTLYVLRGIIDQIFPGQGGKIRPAEYFDMIGAAGPNALAALLFAKFAFSIDEALEFCYEFSSRMEKADDVFRAKQGEDLDENDWEQIEEENAEPDVQIETVRRQILSNTWSELISRQVTDWLEQSKHKENGKFNYKSPEAYVGVGRCRAAVMGSEAPGFGANGGVNKDRIYHAPRWHRSYTGRHTTSQYTLYAIALGTCASPGIISNGLLFPDLHAPGTHIVHNPVELLLEECGKIWPGLHASLILSIGTGNLALPGQWDFQARPYGFTSATACLKISEATSKTAKNIEKYILPHHKMYQNAYFRFNVLSDLPLFENESKEFILSKTLEYLEDGHVATRAARVADRLEEDAFPDMWEDHVVLSSLALLLATFASTGHNTEAEMVSDSISTFILYEPTRIDSGTRRKLIMAVKANQLADGIRRKSPWTDPDLHGQRTTQTHAADYFLNALMAYGEVGGLPVDRYQGHEFGQLNSMSDIAAAVYYVLTVIRSQKAEWLDNTVFTTVLSQVAALISMAAETTPALTSRLEELLTISSISSICEAACLEYLTAEPRLLLNGSFIRRLTNIMLQTDLQKIDLQLLEPMANAIAAIVRLGKWSSIRNSLIVRLLEAQQEQRIENWALVNLAVEWKAQAANNQQSGPSNATSECDTICQKFMDDFNEAFKTQKPGVSIRSVKRGYLGLLRKALEGDELQAQPRTSVPRPCVQASSLLESAITHKSENLFHLSAKSAFIPAMKMMLEALGTVQSKKYLAEKDNDGFCPMHIACRRRGDLDTVLLCLYGGADINTVGPGGQTALHFCFPRKEDIQDFFEAFQDFTQEHGLLLTLPLKRPRAWGLHGKGQEIGHNTFLLRRMVNQIACRAASINTKDQCGATPAHLAAANGWGINVDALFSRSGAEAEDMVHDCLLAKDKQGNTVLSLMRAMADDEGEKIILAEMRKRCIDTAVSGESQNILSPSIYGTDWQQKYVAGMHMGPRPDFVAVSQPYVETPLPKPTQIQSPIQRTPSSYSTSQPSPIYQRPMMNQSPSQAAHPPTPPSFYPASKPSSATTTLVSTSQSPPTGSPMTPRQVSPAAGSPVYSQPYQYSPAPQGTLPIRPSNQYPFHQQSSPQSYQQPYQQPYRQPQGQRVISQPSVSRLTNGENPLDEKRGNKLLKKIFK